MTGYLEDDCEKVGVERRLIEDFSADPLTTGDLLRPRVILLAVADEHREQRRAAQFDEVHYSQCKSRDANNDERQPAAQILLIELRDLKGQRSSRLRAITLRQ